MVSKVRAQWQSEVSGSACSGELAYCCYPGVAVTSYLFMPHALGPCTLLKVIAFLSNVLGNLCVSSNRRLVLEIQCCRVRDIGLKPRNLHT